MLASCYPTRRHDETLWPQIKLAYIALLYDHSSPSAPRRSSTRSRAACSTGAITATSTSSGGRRSRPSTSTAASRPTAATTRRRTACACDASRGIARAFEHRGAVRGSRARHRARCVAALREHFSAAWRAPAQLPNPGALVALLPKQGARTSSAASSTAGTIPVRRAAAPGRRRRSSTSTRCCSTDETSGALFSLARAYFMVDMEVPSAYVEFLESADAEQAEGRALHDGRAAEAGQDALLPGPPAST